MTTRMCAFAARAAALVPMLLHAAPASAQDEWNGYEVAIGDIEFPICGGPSVPVPIIRQPVVAHSDALWLGKFQPGLTARIHDGAGTFITSSVVQADGRVDLPFAIPPGQEVRVDLTDGVTTTSSRVVPVVAGPPSGDEPHVLHPLTEGARGIAVQGIHPGTVVVTRNVSVTPSVEMDRVFAGRNAAVTLDIDPVVAGDQIQVRQEIGAFASPILTLTVGAAPNPATLNTSLEVMGPVVEGDMSVWVSGVTPGSQVVVTDLGGTPIGAATAGEPIVQVPTCTMPVGNFEVRAIRNGVTRAETFTVIPAFATSPSVVASDVSYGSESCDPSTSSPYPPTQLNARHYRLSSTPADAPIVLIHHGLDLNYESPGVGACDLPGVGYFEPGSSSDPLKSDSYLGYDYLGERLASLGLHVLSLDAYPHDYGLADDWARCTLEVVEQARAQQGLAARHAILIGHSTGGEAIFKANDVWLPHWNATHPSFVADPLEVLATVGLAPVEVGSATGSFDAPVTLSIIGAEDNFWGSFDVESLEAFDIRQSLYQSAVVVPGLTHRAMNDCWDQKPLGLSDPEDVLPTSAAQDLVGDLVVDFVRGAALPLVPAATTFENDDLLRRMFGTIRPPGTYGHHVRYAALDLYDALPLETWGQGFPGLGIAGDSDPSTNNLYGDNFFNGWTPIDAGGPEQPLSDLHPSGADLVETARSSADHVLAVSWDGGSTPSARLEIPDYVVAISAFQAMDHLSVTLSILNGSGVSTPEVDPTVGFDFVVGLDDGTHHAKVRLGAAGSFHIPTGAVRTDTSHPFMTARIPLSAFEAADPAFDFSSLEAVTIDQNVYEEGSVMFDSVVFHRSY